MNPPETSHNGIEGTPSPLAVVAAIVWRLTRKKPEGPGLTVGTIAEKIGCDRTTLHRLVADARSVIPHKFDPDVFRRLCDLAGLGPGFTRPILDLVAAWEEAQKTSEAETPSTVETTTSKPPSTS